MAHDALQVTVSYCFTFHRSHPNRITATCQENEAGWQSRSDSR